MLENGTDIRTIQLLLGRLSEMSGRNRTEERRRQAVHSSGSFFCVQPPITHRMIGG
jgi:hypothetical protein